MADKFSGNESGNDSDYRNELSGSDTERSDLSDLEAVDEDEDDITEKWKHTVLKNASQLKIDADPFETQLLEQVISEWNQVRKQLIDAMQSSLGVRKVSDLNIIKYLFEPLCQYLLTHVNRVRLRQGKEEKTLVDIISFIQVEIRSSCFNLSPTAVYDCEFLQCHLCKYLSKRDYFSILQSLKEQYNDNHTMYVRSNYSCLYANTKVH